jgi:hypothetical protein
MTLSDVCTNDLNDFVVQPGTKITRQLKSNVIRKTMVFLSKRLVKSIFAHKNRKNLGAEKLKKATFLHKDSMWLSDS